MKKKEIMKKLLWIFVMVLGFNAFATEYYVSVKGNNRSDGLTEATAWRTITYAATKAKSGDTVWIKSGNYGNENVLVENNGTKANPISFIGYKSKPGDITTMYYTYEKGRSLNAKEMPMLDGGHGGINQGFTVRSDYVIVKNIQITNYSTLMYVTNAPKGVVIDNILAHTAGRTKDQPGSQGIGILFNSDKSDGNTIKNSIAVNCSVANFRIYGNNNLIENCKSYADRNDEDNGEATDYYIVIRGLNNVIRNSYVERVGNLTHKGHGISLKAKGVPTENNLIDNCTIVNAKGSIELRHSQVKNNIVRNSTIIGPSGSIVIRDGANNNIVEKSLIKDSSEGIRFYDQTEDGQGGVVASNNIIRNTIFQNIGKAIVSAKSSSVTKIGVVKNNNIENCTFNNIDNLFLGSLPIDNTNNMINNIFNNIKNYDHKSSKYQSKWVHTYNNYYNNGFEKFSGKGNISEAPQFVDFVEFIPQNSALKTGTQLQDVVYDIYGVKRDNPPTIGAVEIETNNKDSVNANAGEDQSICLGESVTLTASGGSAYKWSNEATTKSIKVNPTETTTYSVTVSEGSASETDEVVVTVNSVTAEAGSDVTINEGESTTLTASGGDTYSWSNGETTKSITVSPTATETYKVTVAKSGCEASDNVKVTVVASSPPPATVKANAGEDQPICLGESVTLTASGGSSYEWNTGAKTKSITINPTETTTYSVTVSEGAVSDTDEVIVTVNSVTADAGSNKTIEEGESVTLTATGGDSYKWNTGATTESITVSPDKTTDYSVTVTKGNCEDTDEVKVTVNPKQQVSVAANAGEDQTICFGESVTLTASGGSAFKWNTGETTKSITVNLTETTTYSVTVSEGSASDTDEVVVTVNSVTAEAGSNKTIEEGESVTLTATGGDSYKWNTGETTESITVSPNKTTKYSVTVSKGNCKDTDEVKVTVNSKQQVSVAANAGHDKTIEEGESVTLTASGGSSYKWSTGETTKSITVKPDETTTYMVEVFEGSVSDSDEVIVTVNPKQQVSVKANAGEDQTICFGETVKLTASGGSSYKWSTGDTTKSITVNPNKTTNYTVTVSEGNSSDSDDVTVTVNSLIVDAGLNKIIEEGESVTLTATGGDSYKWNTGETTQSITVSPGKTKIYSVIVTKNGCEDTDSVQVTVNLSQTSNPPTANAEAGENITICLGESTTLTANGGDSYKWSSGDTDKTISVSPLRTTTYTLEATRGGVTTSDTVTVIVENCSISSDIEGLENDLKIYPNPSTGTINVVANNNNESLNLDVINLNGSLVYSEKVTNKYNAFEKQLDLSRLAKGVYIVRLYNSNYNDSKKIILY